jgi:hypothetical protein
MLQTMKRAASAATNRDHFMIQKGTVAAIHGDRDRSVFLAADPALAP